MSNVIFFCNSYNSDNKMSGDKTGESVSSWTVEGLALKHKWNNVWQYYIYSY